MGYRFHPKKNKQLLSNRTRGQSKLDCSRFFQVFGYTSRNHAIPISSHAKLYQQKNLLQAQLLGFQTRAIVESACATLQNQPGSPPACGSFVFSLRGLSQLHILGTSTGGQVGQLGTKESGGLTRIAPSGMSPLDSCTTPKTR